MVIIVRTKKDVAVGVDKLKREDGIEDDKTIIRLGGRYRDTPAVRDGYKQIDATRKEAAGAGA